MFLNNLICKANAGLVVFYILDVLIIVAILVTLYFMFFRKPKSKNQDSPKNEPKMDENKVKVSQIKTEEPNIEPEAANENNWTPEAEEVVVLTNISSETEKTEPQNNVPAEETYVVPSNDFSKKKTKTTPKKPYVNHIERFSTQITNLNEEASEELKSKVNAKPRVSEEPIKRIVKDETIVLNDKISGQIKVTSYEGTTALLNTLKEEQSGTSSAPKPNKPKTKPAAKKKTESKKTDKAAPKRKYTKKNKDEAK